MDQSTRSHIGRPSRRRRLRDSALAALALLIVGLSSGVLVPGWGDNRILTLRTSSATLSWTVDAPPLSKRNLKRELARVRETLEHGQAGTYIGDLLERADSAVSRWPSRIERPIRVWVSEAWELDGYSERVEAEVQQAFRDWQTAGVPLAFGFVRDSALSEVQVAFIQQFDDNISGNTVWARDQNYWIVGGRITIALENSAGLRLSPLAIRALTSHEVGHLIGLDHASDSLSIMSSLVRVKNLSTTDRATASLLYSLPAGVLR